MRVTKIILLTLLVSMQVLLPKQITFNEAQTIAENWTYDLEKRFNDQVRVADGREIFREGIIVAYVFDLYPKGFVIISPQDYLPPIKMYTLENNFDKAGPFIHDIIFSGNAKIIDKVNKGELSAEKNFSTRNKRDFSYFLRDDSIYNAQSSSRSDVVQEVGPLLTTKWGQGSPYNDSCPIINIKTAPAGCNATALSQMMNFYEWPAKGIGSEYYYDWLINQTITTNFEKEYEWWNMQDEYGYGTEEENNAVATLIYDVGVAIHSSYLETNTSAGYDFHYNFIDHFYYSPDLTHIHWANYQKLDSWFNVAKNQIDNGWPCEYGIGGTYGHSVVTDGYRIDGNTKMVHINFGWNGSHTGYFAMNNIFISDVYDFTDISGQTMTINFYPYPDYKKQIGLPPASITAEAFLNRSVFLSEYIIKLSWSESPSQDKKLEEYIIYRQKNGSIEELDRVSPENKTYEIRIKALSNYQYSVGVIDKNGAISDIPSFVSPILK